ncbi:spindle pole body interacting protein [Dacryopinax primogenitus]|uniref:Spindle pole body interacting protein n=1 Tax=Dacryopinax primogenitus (strain DJM 731) TaxID=1858805 RepID=M5FWT2_DACPD|nr:spindle pole body interacting protein [Dacryopinax primogenitus]EJU02421.1 spindle pole body interacting protein [Dacryopinax primogenitus]
MAMRPPDISPSRSGEHVSYILVAEFDIDTGSQLTHQFPYPTGADKQLLAEVMLPEGVHNRSEDWTVFLLNQNASNTISSVFSRHSIDSAASDVTTMAEERPELMYGLSLVRTKHDAAAKRKAHFKAMALCTHHPFIQIYKPVLSLALDQFYVDPSVETLSRLFDAVNAMDTSPIPHFTHMEKLILRGSDRNDCFAEKFLPPPPSQQPPAVPPKTQAPSELGSQTDLGTTEYGSDESGTKVDPAGALAEYNRSRAASVTSVSETSSVGGGRKSFDAPGPVPGTGGGAPGKDWTTRHKRPSFDRVSSASSTGSRGLGLGMKGSSDSHEHSKPRAGTLGTRDTHFYNTSIVFKGVTLPIRIPLSTFRDEIGDFSLVKLIQTFSSPTAGVSGPLHPHLHTNGVQTHPLILIFNALITEKNVVFLGANHAAKDVVDYVLAACALGSGGFLRGMAERAYPYAPVAIRDIMETTTGYIAGVVNQIFESFPTWDILCNIETGQITVNKNIKQPGYSPVLTSGAFTRQQREGDDDRESLNAVNGATSKFDNVGRPDAADNGFMEDITSAIQAHYGETVIRMRMGDYILRFTRLASLYEQEAFGETHLGNRSSNFAHGELGSGVGILDDLSRAREFSPSCQQRIEAWRRTRLYKYHVDDYRNFQQVRAIRGFDPVYQIQRLRMGKNVPEFEVEAIVRTLRDSVQTYEQVTELLALLPPYSGGLLPITFCLFHPQHHIREWTIDFLEAIQRQPIGRLFIHSLNLYHRLAYKRLVQTRNAQADVAKRNTVLAATAFGIPSAGMSLLGSTPSNQSQSSLITS